MPWAVSEEKGKDMWWGECSRCHENAWLTGNDSLCGSCWYWKVWGIPKLSK